MTKSELIDKLTEKLPERKRLDAETIVETVFGAMTEALAKGDRVEIRGFGSFQLRERRARIGRNPKSGVKVEVEEKKVPFFKAGKDLKILVDKSTKKSAE
jgi:integration host factor subunit beta